jgi:hypothetical protein
MLVTIVYVPTADRMGPDTARMGKVEDVPDDLARQMVNFGEARVPTEDELAAYEEARASEQDTSEASEAQDAAPTPLAADAAAGAESGETAAPAEADA